MTPTERMYDALLIDGTNLAHRTWAAQAHAMKDSGNEPDPLAVAGTVRNQVIRFLGEFALVPRRVIAAFDGGGSSGRSEMYPEYKANRAPRSESCRAALTATMETLEGVGVRIVRVEGYEADDLIATIVTGFESQGFVTGIISGDSDLRQLASPLTTVLAIGQSINTLIPFTPATFRDKYKFWPPLLADYKALVGEVGDNIEGVRGIGPTYATRLLSNVGGIDRIYELVNAYWRDKAILTPRVAELLIEGEEIARRNLKLTTLKRDVQGIVL